MITQIAVYYYYYYYYYYKESTLVKVNRLVDGRSGFESQRGNEICLFYKRPNQL